MDKSTKVPGAVWFLLGFVTRVLLDLLGRVIR